MAVMNAGADADAALLAGRPAPAGGYDADVIILMLDRLDETMAAADSALGQLGLSLHVLVLDQGSATAARAAFAARYADCARLGYYAAARNLGVAGGRNLVSGLGRGRVIVALDNDAVFADAGVARRAVDGFDQDTGLGAMAFRILARDGVRLDMFSWGYPPVLLGRAGQRFFTTTYVGAGHAIRRRAWEAAGGYDPALYFTWEEYDFCLRLINAGWRVLYDGGLAVRHDVSPERRVAWQDARTTLYIRNRLMIGRKWRRSWLVLAPLVLGYLARGVAQGRLRAAWAGLAQAVAADRYLDKMPMSAAMRRYLWAHERRYRGVLGWRRVVDLFRRRRDG